MKKVYLILLFLPIATLCMSQIGYSWWQFLPSDFETNPAPRATVMIQKVNDDVIANTNSLEELWGNVGDDFIYPIDFLAATTVEDYTSGDKVVTDLPVASADDYTGSYSILAGADALYVLYNVVDDEVDVTRDLLEMHFAPYGSKYDPGREIYPDMSRGPGGGRWWEAGQAHVWGAFDEDTDMPGNGAIVISGADYVEMSKYCSWTEAGAYKVELKLESSQELFPSALNYSLKGDNNDILGDVSGGSIGDVAMQALFEQTSNGYLYLSIIPWDVMKGSKLENNGDQMSIATKVNDFDGNNLAYVDKDGNAQVARYDSWGGATDNSVYFAIAYYGAIGELTDGPLATADSQKEVINAYYSNEMLFIENSDRDLDVKIYDLKGELMTQHVGENQIDVSLLIPGYYVASILDNKGNKSSIKFVK
ncbi:MAG: T9SS type A sorting domain-containing protein [Saprospiraceae bacterium]